MFLIFLLLLIVRTTLDFMLHCSILYLDILGVQYHLHILLVSIAERKYLVQKFSLEQLFSLHLAFNLNNLLC